MSESSFSETDATAAELLSLDAAIQLLRQFNCTAALTTDPTDPTLVTGPALQVDRALLRQALYLAVAASEHQLLGICADSLAEGIQALQSYTRALDYCPKLDLSPVEGAVYLKFNPYTGQCYASPYSGSHRGVLVACQSTEGGLNEMFGHLPLDLFSSKS